MNFVLTLSLAGSCMVGLTILVAKVGRGYFTKRCEFIMIKVAMIFFLVPLSFLKECFMIMFKHGGAVSAMLSTTPITSFNYKNVMVTNGVSVIPNYILLINGIICFVWIALAVILFVKSLTDYFVFRRKFILASVKVVDTQKLYLFEQLRNEYGIKRQIHLYSTRASVSTFTIGLWKPLIIVSAENMNSSFELAIRHELTHIKCWDAAYRFIHILVYCVHWFNPLLYIVKNKLHSTSECACDERTIQMLTIEKRVSYAKLLVNGTCIGSDAQPWAATLSNNGKVIGERVITIMKNRKTTKWHKIISSFVLVAMMLTSSITVLAYDDISTLEVTRVNGEGTIDNFQTVDFRAADLQFSFIAESVQQEYPVLYEREFINANGEIFQVSEDDGISLYWPHTCVMETGIMQVHNTYSNGECQTVGYNAERCMYCGDCVLLSEAWRVLYPKCPH